MKDSAAMQTAYTDDGYVKYWTDTIKARKPHRCFGCERAIGPRETCERQTHLRDGYWERFYTCSDCLAWLAAHPGYFNDDLWGEGDVAEARRQEGN